MADLFRDKVAKRRMSPISSSITPCKQTVLAMLDLSNLPANREFAVFTSCGIKLPNQEEGCYSFVGIGPREYLLNDGPFSNGGFWYRAELVPEHLYSGFSTYTNPKDLDKAKITSLQAAIANLKSRPTDLKLNEVRPR